MSVEKTDLMPMTKDQKANPLGEHLLHHYYTTTVSRLTGENKINYPVFNIDHPKDIPLIMHCAEKEALKTYGMIVMVGGRHHTPVLVHNDDVFIIESLGTDKSKVGVSCVAQIAKGVSNFPGAPKKIHSFQENRQYDSVSCGADSYIALKQALRIAESLPGFAKSQEVKDLVLDESKIINLEEKEDPYFAGSTTISQIPYLPPQIGKYTQAQSPISRHPMRSVQMSSSPSESQLKSTETMQEYATRHKKQVSVLDTVNPEKEYRLNEDKPVPPEQDEKVTLKGRKHITSNYAVGQRREKHARIVQELIQEKSISELKEIVKESSGINLISRHLEDIPIALLEGKSKEVNESSVETLIDNWVEDEMKKKRAGKDDVAPRGELSLTELTSSLVKMHKSEPSRKLQSGG